MLFSEILIQNKKDWQKTLSSILCYDIYQTSDYAELFAEYKKNVLLSFSEDKYNIIFPILIREIDNTGYADATSVYGYAGILSNIGNIPLYIRENFRKNLISYFNENQIVSGFSRLHPLIPESTNFPENLGTIEAINETVYIDLSLSEEEQTGQYSHSLRRQLKNIHRAGITCRVADNNEYGKFASLYYGTMDRLNADENYYFPLEYFKKMAEATDFRTIFIYAEYKNQLIGGGLFTCCNDFMQYHLGAVPEEFLLFSPLKIIIDTARQIGTRMRMKYLHLGGGYDGKEGGLLDFKSRFSKKRAVFKVWKWIANESAYIDLVNKKFGKEIPENNYFPLYRLK